MKVKMRKGKLNKKHCPNCFGDVVKEKDDNGGVSYFCGNCDLIFRGN